MANAQVNTHAFIERLTCLGAIFHIDAPWPIWTLRDALEEAQDDQWDEQQVSFRGYVGSFALASGYSIKSVCIKDLNLKVCTSPYGRDVRTTRGLLLG